jgi:hypothetical protein
MDPAMKAEKLANIKSKRETHAKAAMAALAKEMAEAEAAETETKD